MKFQITAAVFAAATLVACTPNETETVDVDPAPPAAVEEVADAAADAATDAAEDVATDAADATGDAVEEMVAEAEDMASDVVADVTEAVCPEGEANCDTSRTLGGPDEESVE